MLLAPVSWRCHRPATSTSSSALMNIMSDWIRFKSIQYDRIYSNIIKWFLTSKPGKGYGYIVNLTLSAWSAAKNCSQTRKTKQPQPMCTKFEHVVLPGLQNSNPIHCDDSFQGSVYKSRRRRCHPQMVPWPSNVLNPWSCILRCWRCGWWFRTWNLGQAKHPHC